MDNVLDLSQVEKLLNGIAIPPRPQLLQEIDKALQADDPNLARIAELVNRDVGISAAVLKTLNSPVFGLSRKVGNVAQAINLLGTRNTRSVVTGLVLRSALGKMPSMERFWDSAEKVAGINAYICSRLPRLPREEAYTFGLFRDCGIPLMLFRFPDYRETLKEASTGGRKHTDVEDARHETNHATVGFLFARNWGLSEAVCEAIRHHHDLDMLEQIETLPALSRTLICINFVAEHLHNSAIRMRDDPDWERHGNLALDYLGFGEDEYLELSEDIPNLC